MDGNFIDALGRPSEIYEQRVSANASAICPGLTSVLDTAVPAQEKLRAHLPATYDLRASV